MINKKGQISIYIIMGIVILIVVGLLFFFRGSRQEPVLERQITLDSVKASVENYVDSCLFTEGEFALIALGYQGGYLFPPEFGTTDFEGFAVPYDYYLGYNMLPGLGEIEVLHMNDFLESTLEECIADLNTFKEFAVIDTGDIKVNTTINYDDVVISLDYPVRITVADSSTELKQFTHRYDVRLGKVLAVADSVIEQIVEDPNWVDLTFLNDFDVRVQVMPITATENMYFITDGESFLRGRPYVFAFAAQYTENHPPYIYPIRNFELKKGEPFQYFVEAVDFDNDPITYRDDSNLFEIDPSTGEISFTPVETGFTVVTIYAEDTYGFIDSREFFIEVVE